MTSAVRPRLVVLDSVLIDLTLRVVALPSRGGDVRSEASLVTPGGGFNVLAAAARQGMATIYGGRLGAGPFASLARDALQSEGIGVPGGDDGDDDLGVCVVVIDRAGERTFITAPGAELGLRRRTLDALEVRPGDYVYLSGYNLAHPELAAVIAPWLDSVTGDAVVALDPGARVLDSEPATLARVLARTDWLLASAGECRALSGLDSTPSAAAELRTRVHRGVIVHDGDSGCLVVEHGVDRVASFDTEVIDTNGAGDAHNGVLLAELARGTPTLEAARRANAAAAMAIAARGPATAPTRAGIDAFLEARRR